MRRHHEEPRPRWGLRLQQVPAWFSIAVVASLLGGSWALVHAAGGSHTALPHLFYLPIVLAALPFGIPGGLTAGLLATVLCGPLMPLDVASGEAQDVANWLTRGVFFVSVGALSGATTGVLRRSFASELSAQLDLAEDHSADGAGSPQVAEDGDPAWEARIMETIEQESFRTVFQPIYRIGDGCLSAVEALTRFDDAPVRPPDAWFDAAQRVGLGLDLELVTLASALRGSAELDGDVTMSFNASPDLLVDPRLVSLLDGYPGRVLMVEVTEHAIIEDYPRVEAALRSLRDRGLLVAIDDAGAGFASLRHIVRLEPDIIKLDRSLTENIRHDPVRRPLAEALLRFAEQTDTGVIVEGLETAADLAAWRELGAFAAQGFVLAHPGELPFAPIHRSLAVPASNADVRGSSAHHPRRRGGDRRGVTDRRGSEDPWTQPG